MSYADAVMKLENLVLRVVSDVEDFLSPQEIAKELRRLAKMVEDGE